MATCVLKEKLQSKNKRMKPEERRTPQCMKILLAYTRLHLIWNYNNVNEMYSYSYVLQQPPI